jgi:hypothetical protein
LLIRANCGKNTGSFAPLTLTGKADMADHKTGAAAPQQNKTDITKQEAVRRAVAALGKKAGAQDIQKYVKETFNIDMTIDHIYTAKSSVLAKRKKAATKPAAPKPVSTTKPQAGPAPAIRKATVRFSLDDLHTVKALVGRVGAEQLRTLIELLAK